VTGIELQKLGIVPQTVFLRHRGSGGSGSQHGSRRASGLGYPGKSPLPGTPRSQRAHSIDIGPSGGAPFDDLRRRLATINGSANSLVMPPPNPVTRDPRPMPSIPSQLNKVPIMSPEVAVLQQRPGSPTESVISTSGSAVLRTTARGLHMGSFDQKAAPAVGSSKMNATGLLEPASKMRSEGSPERSGRSSPTSGGGTLRGVPPPRPRSLSLLPISSYGTQTNFGVSPFDLETRARRNGTRCRSFIRTHVPRRKQGSAGRLRAESSRRTDPAPHHRPTQLCVSRRDA
jgi:phosphoinositide-3-kinase regulatory subunit 4